MFVVARRGSRDAQARRADETLDPVGAEEGAPAGTVAPQGPCEREPAPPAVGGRPALRRSLPASLSAASRWDVDAPNCGTDGAGGVAGRIEGVTRAARSDRLPSSIGSRVVALRRSAASVLDRPLTSLHLVVGVLAALTGLGLVMVLSASAVDSYTQTGNPYAVFERQVVYCAVGLVLSGAAMRVPARRLRAWSPWLVVVSLALLVAVLVPGLGSSVAGAQKWFVVGGISLQPSEPAKLALVLWGAHVLAVRRRSLHQWRVALLPLVPVALLLAALVVVQPDLGSAICVIVVLFALLWFAGVPAGLLALLGAGTVASVLLLATSASYRMTRLTSFLSPDAADPLGPGYQAREALFSLADGGVLGAGLGQGAAQWSYLPNASNDFIFAIVGEELGFVGAATVLGLFALLAYTGLRIAARTTDPWTRNVVATLTAWLVAQAAINVGYVLGLVPVTGITLPLISSGGSSVVVTMLALGIMAAAAREEPEARAALAARPNAGRPRKAPPHLVTRRPAACSPTRARAPGRVGRARRPGRQELP